MTRKRLNENELLDRLGRKHQAPAWAFLTQVRNATGYSHGRTRTADALAMSLWPSRGLELHGFEVKSRRSDWLSELKNPKKAEEIARFCHRWWLVAENDVVELSELPPSWGLMVPKGRGLHVVEAAELQEAQTPTYSFLAAILRKVEEGTVPFSSIQAKLEKRFVEGCEQESGLHKYEKENFQKLKEAVAAFEKASGVKIDRYGYEAESMGAAVEVVRRLGKDAIAKQIRVSRTSIARLLESIDSVVKEFENGKEIT